MLRVAQLGAFIHRRGMPLAVAAITRQHLEEWIALPIVRPQLIGTAGRAGRPA